MEYSESSKDCPELLDPVRHDRDDFSRYLLNLANAIKRDIDNDTETVDRAVRRIKVGQ